MRLKQIRLAGFKSFVEPTQVPLPGAMTAVVGPNGCGKSNIIDAVRWVLGESSAKNLRGEAMTDVIFNGSSARKAVSQASVELLFDNSEGRLAGPWANFAEISVRRLVNRDGDNSYFLNGSRCRRKDITELFLGTGLGPRSYAIIEQGMIARLIESRPQELRVFIEEAAGISRYKEKRRDSESRLRQTRDNLERLNDVRDELGLQLEKLKRQAASARRYRELRARERQLKAELASLRHQALAQQLSARDDAIAMATASLEASDSQLQQQESSELRLTLALEEQAALQRQQQQQMLQLAPAISRLEQQLLAGREQQRRQQQEAQRLEQEWQQLQGEQQQLAERQQQLAVHLAAADDALQQAEQQSAELQQALAGQEAQTQLQHQQLRQLRQQHSEQLRQREQASASSRQLQQLQQELTARVEQLRAEAAVMAPLAEVDWAQPLAEQQGLWQQAEQQLAAAQLAEQQHEQAHLVAASACQQLREQLADCRGQCQLLRHQLQAAGQDQGGKAGPRWLDGLIIEPRWQQAASALLAPFAAAALLADHQPLPGISAGAAPAAEQSLASVISGAGQLNHWLSAIHLAEDLDSALAQRATLTMGHSLLTPCGQWLGPGWWLSLQGGASSPLLWQQQWRELEEQQQVLQQQLEQQQQLERQQQQQLAAARQQRQQAQQHCQQQAAQLQQLRQQAALAEQAQASRAEQQQHCQQRLHSEQQRLAQLQPQLQQAQLALVAAEAQLAASEPQLEQLEQQLATASQARSQLQQQWQRLHQQQQQQARQQAGLAAEQQGTQLAAERLASQQQQLASRRQQLQAEQLLVAAEDEQQLQLAALLDERQLLDEQLAHSSAAVAALADERNNLQQQRRRLNQLREQQRSALDQLRLEREGLASRLAVLVEQLAELAIDVAAVAAQLPADADEQRWASELEHCVQAIGRLGPINLAAIDEYDAQAERKAYLDHQYGDLLQAVEALEGAIRRIDKETRQRFRDTFDKVDQGLQQLFPKVFGGGSASLALTDDDLLEAGVAIMARPPGKKNSTIHLLSGGEKALTALSLVFAIFQLNPAPFCMLDEVDAPLDDANVGRFCNLVREMSASVQFVFISHNKVAMEMATHLTGVTMHEPGVSRMVAVDIEQALSFVQTA